MGWTACANLEGASHKEQMTTARAPSSFSDYPFWFSVTMRSLFWVPSSTQPARTKCSRSSLCSSFELSF